MENWRTHARRTVLQAGDGRFLKVEYHTVELPNGHVIENWPWLITPDYVNIVAETVDGEFICFRQTKYAVPGLSLAIAGGYLEPEEDPLAGAQRELLEETGYVAGEWTPLGEYAVDGNREQQGDQGAPDDDPGRVGVGGGLHGEHGRGAERRASGGDQLDLHRDRPRGSHLGAHLQGGPLARRDRERLGADDLAPDAPREPEAIAADAPKAGLVVIGRAKPGPRDGDDARGIGGGHSTDPSWPPSFVA